jgi:hypothetical protein
VRVQVRGQRPVPTSWVAPILITALAGAVLLIGAQYNWAQNGIDVRFHAFQDSRGVTVLEPTVSLDKDFTDRTGLRVKFGADAITAASDSCARCHPEEAQNRRTFFDFGLRRKMGDWKVIFGGQVSVENFYRSSTGSLSASRDLNKGNTTIAGGYSFSYNRPGLHPSENTESQFEHNVTASVTQTLTKATIAQVSYSLDRVSGYQNSPYLRTSVNGVMQLGHVPDLRNRQAVTVRLRQGLPAETYLEADYRRYFDTWQIQSNTVSLGLSHYFTPVVMAGFSYRWYDQTGAAFYQPRYAGNPEFFTGDYRLAPFTSGLYTGRLVITPRDGLWFLPRGTAFDAQYERYLANTGFEAATISLGFHVPLK